MKVGLVLGGGGLAGATFHAAALAALEIDLGWDARRADVILGTSSGALTGALLTLGVTGADLAAFVSGAPLPANHFLVRRGAELPDLPAATWRHFIPRPRAQDLRRLARSFQSPGAAILGMLPHGTVDLEHHIGFLEAEAWPASDLRICAVRQDDHELVVWDGAGPASLAVAVAASSTIPGYARPIRVGDHDYVDGGLRSPTNADTLLDDGLDVALILSPMTPDSGSSIGIRGALNMWASRRLQREVTALRRAGTEVIVLRSPTELGRAATSPFVSLRKRPKGSVAEALISVGDQAPRFRSILGQRTSRNAFASRSVTVGPAKSNSP